MRYWIVFLAFVIAAIGSPAKASATDIPAFELHAGRDPAPVAPYIRYSKDVPDFAGLRPGDLVDRPLERIKGETIHFGPPGVRTALFLKVRNAGSTQGSWILTTGRGSLKFFRLYEAAGDRFDLRVDGTDPETARRNLGTYQAFSSELVLDPGQEKLILIEFLSENSTYMPLKISTYGTFFKERRSNISMVSGVVIGAFILLLLNFLFFSITGHREFLWLAVAEGFFALNTVHSEGYFTIFFLYDKPLVGVAVEDFFKCGFAGAMAQFCRVFVNTRTNFPKRDIALKVLIFCSLAVMILQPGLSLYPPGLRFALHVGGWLVAIAVALFLPFVGFAAMKQLGYQLWPLFVGWASLALFIIYAAIASMGFFTWLPINWHLSGPIGLFESVMVTLALGLNLKKIQRDKVAADFNYARSLSERLAISERAARLAEEKAFALATVNSQNALLHASGHDSKQVILALNTAVDVLRRSAEPADNGELIGMLQSSATYLNEIVSTTMSGANIVGSDSGFVALSSFKGQALVEPLMMMFRTPFARKNLVLETEGADDITIVSDKPLLMRALANLLSNSYQYSDTGGAKLSLARDGDSALITIADTGRGMSDAVRKALNASEAARLRADEGGEGTGSGFHAARRLVESLSGRLEILSSTAAGTIVRVTVPCAFDNVAPCQPEELQAALPDWVIVDFDQRQTFEAALAAATRPAERIIALTYDDTTVTRGRLSEVTGMMMIKPPCRELIGHPLLRRASEQV
ncbi:signal transduction histidine kinase [Sphingopyxis panaciterrae]|uniref:sensor histidine kinase n=1 Tax=Sphingopyxis panaciterrae TaxID=363841 RepID=UPI00141E97BA|nr:sensor histidine kinase [Sphingopyxis panaciterrae]NIJ39698.1 signal transduction histidine kinase [Sphingopyxis panaciterrae]